MYVALWIVLCTFFNAMHEEKINSHVHICKWLALKMLLLASVMSDTVIIELIFQYQIDFLNSFVACKRNKLSCMLTDFSECCM